MSCVFTDNTWIVFLAVGLVVGLVVLIIIVVVVVVVLLIRSRSSPTRFHRSLLLSICNFILTKFKLISVFLAPSLYVSQSVCLT